MKLFRHHTQKFQDAISNSNSFVLDLSRKYNDTGRNKNEAQLFFYSTTKEGAENYADDMTKLFEYDASGLNILDLRIEKNRSFCVNTITSLIKEEEEIKASMRKYVPAKFLDDLAKKETTSDCIINDRVVSGASFWGQRASDFENGVALRKDLEELGFDGVIFKDNLSIEVALLKAI